MKDALVFVLDQGHMKAFEYHKDELNHKSMDLLMSYDNMDHLRKTDEVMSDQEGRFGHVKGENHQRKTEGKMKFMKKMAMDMMKIMMAHPGMPCCLAAEKSMNNTIMKMTDNKIRDRIIKNEASDLLYMSPMQIMQRFAL